jgi:hypothetical protein
LFTPLKKLPLTDLEGNLMLQNVIQLSNENNLIKNSLRYYLKSLLNILDDMEINKPLFSFTLPGLILGTIGFYMSLNSMENYYHNGSFDLENTLLMTLLILVGTCMAFMGVLLNLIAGLIRYKQMSLNNY